MLKTEEKIYPIGSGAEQKKFSLPKADLSAGAGLEVKEMYLKGMHLGYSQTSRNPKMKPYIFGLRNGVEIFDLEKTKKNIDSAKEFAKKLGKEKKVVLFVGTKKEAKDLTENAAKELGMPYVKERWIGGTLTNFKQIKGRIDHLNDLKKKRDTGELDKYTKKKKKNTSFRLAKQRLRSDRRQLSRSGQRQFHIQHFLFFVRISQSLQRRNAFKRHSRNNNFILLGFIF